MKHIIDLVEFIAIFCIVICISGIIGMIFGAAKESVTILLSVAWITSSLALSAVLFGEYKEKQKR